jgi:hypothetical protein
MTIKHKLHQLLQPPSNQQTRTCHLIADVPSSSYPPSLIIVRLKNFLFHHVLPKLPGSHHNIRCIRSISTHAILLVTRLGDCRFASHRTSKHPLHGRQPITNERPKPTPHNHRGSDAVTGPRPNAHPGAADREHQSWRLAIPATSDYRSRRPERNMLGAPRGTRGSFRV